MAAIDDLIEIVGEENVQFSSEKKLAADQPWREAEPSDKFIAVVDFSTVEQLQKILEYCNKNGIGVIPRAGGTSLSNGASVSTYRDGENIILLRDVREPEYEVLGNTAKIIGNVAAKQIETEQDELIVPVDLGIGSKGSGDGRIATLLGYIATNAAGSGAAFKGRAADMVLQLQCVTADGCLWDLPSLVRGAPKLEDVVGMGGTTAVITSATINLIPRPQARAVAALRVDDIDEMYEILERSKEQCWPEMNLFERMNGDLFMLVAGAMERADDAETANLLAGGKGDLLFIELTSSEAKASLKAKLEELLGVHNAIVTDDDKYADWLLGFRVVNASTKGLEYAKKSGGKMVAFDISVPAGDVQEFPSKGLIAEIEAKFDGVDIFYFGHAAGVVKIDENAPKGGTALHFNPVLPAKHATPENEKWLRDKVNEEVVGRGGQIVSEHGIGTKFVAAFKESQPEDYAQMVEKIACFDPKNTLNPAANAYAADVAEQVKQRNKTT